MSPRPIASGTITFGLVTIPVKLYPATQPSAGISFNLLPATDGSRLRQQYVCVKDGEKVDRDGMVKGYEFAKDEYVTFTAEELKALEATATQAIEIAEFLPADAVDAIHFDRPYYLGPDRSADKAYRLLVEALHRSGRVALARYAARGKQYLVLLRPSRDRLVMQQLLYADEVRPASEVPVGDVELKEAEVELALRLIEQTATSEFHPEEYADEVRARTLEAIERKVAGREITVAPAPLPHVQYTNLVEALQASLAQREGAKGRMPARRSARSGEPPAASAGATAKRQRR